MELEEILSADESANSDAEDEAGEEEDMRANVDKPIAVKEYFMIHKDRATGLLNRSNCGSFHTRVDVTGTSSIGHIFRVRVSLRVS